MDSVISSTRPQALALNLDETTYSAAIESHPLVMRFARVDAVG